MTAASADRDLAKRRGHDAAYPVAASKNCYLGCIAVMTAGRLQPMTTATGLQAVGVFRESSLQAAQDTMVKVERDGWYRFANSSAGDAITLSDVGSDCYGVDDQTVAKTNGGATRSVAGVVRDVDASGVWISFK